MTKSPNKQQRVKRQEPPLWREQLEGIHAMHPVDVTVSFVNTAGLLEHVKRFHVLTAGILSSHAKEHVNVAALRRLVERGLTVQDMLDIDVDELAQIIRPVGFYNKARHIMQTAVILKQHANGADVIGIPIRTRDCSS